MKPSGPGPLCVGSFLMTASISSAVIGLFRFSASSSFSFGFYIFLEMCPFHLGQKLIFHVVRDSGELKFSFLFTLDISVARLIWQKLICIFR